MDTNEIEIKFLEQIKAKNRKNTVLGKFFLGFSIIFFISLLLGFLFCKIASASVSDEMKIKIASHFSEIFKGCKSPTDYFAVIISASSADFRYLVLIFASGFTYFCKYATAAMVGVRAFTLGYSLEFFAASIKYDFLSLRHPWISFLLFLASKSVVLALIIYLSVKATFFGEDFRRLRGRRSLILRSPVIYRYIFLFLTALGMIIIINAGYCILAATL